MPLQKNSKHNTMLRIQPPREVALKGPNDLRRETCKPGFDANKFVEKILGPKTDKFTYVADHSKSTIGDFIYSNGSVMSTLTQDGIIEFNRAKGNRVPILGIIFLEIGDIRHTITYLLQPTNDDSTLWLFETYDTAKEWFRGDTAWAQRLAKVMAARYYERTVPSEINIQEYDEHPRCVMWALVFLEYLKKMDLRNANAEDFSKMYDEILKENETEAGFLRLQSIVYGASRKTLKRKHRKVKTRRHGSSLRKTRNVTKRSY
jgi:hypothetical protein